VIGYILSAFVAASFLGLGAGSLVAPRALAENYGIPADGAAALAYVRSVGMRDAVLGLVVLAFLVRRERGALATCLALSSLVGASDFAIVAANRGRAAPASLAIHGTGTLGLLAICLLIRRGS
jgi:hypothetical protein